jgi:hypothetical protein
MIIALAKESSTEMKGVMLKVGKIHLGSKVKPADRAQEIHTTRRAKPVSYQLQRYTDSSVRNDPFFIGQRQQPATTALVGELDATLSAFNKTASHSSCKQEK